MHRQATSYLHPIHTSPLILSPQPFTMETVTLATCSLNQWALDFTGNLARIRASIEQARAAGASYRLGPELETCGYGCEDHFHEPDTEAHSWEILADIIASDLSDNMLIDIGAPVYHQSVLYNCRVFVLNGEIVHVRPKTVLADDGNYRESRWFRSWPPDAPLQDLTLPPVARAATKSHRTTAPFGANAALVDADGVTLAAEICEELWVPHAPHVDLYLSGVDIVTNGSASHYVLRKLAARVDLVLAATRASGGVYLYANQRGCDGGRLYYDGAPLAASNGSLLAQGGQFGLASEVDFVTVTVSLDEVRAYRAGLGARGRQAAEVAAGGGAPVRIRLEGGFRFAQGVSKPLTNPMQSARVLKPPEEIAYGPACWLWDYLRRSGMRGFFLPLSGGADSCATAVIVGCMCQQLVAAANLPGAEPRLLSEIRHVAGADSNYVPDDARELAERIFVTAYMGAERASSPETRTRAAKLASQVGSWHVNVEIDGLVSAALSAVRAVFGKSPRFRADGGSATENLALQNVQARSRMLLGYLLAQLANWARGRDGSLLVLGSANVDEALRGYLTKYDCSAADVNPIGGISKQDLRAFLRWAATPSGLGYPAAAEVVEAPPTAELEPIVNGAAQTDEEDMGVTYEELSLYGRWRKIGRCGPVSMFAKAVAHWCGRLAECEVARKVKFFFRMYAINRHKMTTLTPAYHAEDYSPEDNRFDLRLFLYNTRWTWQFGRIDALVREREDANGPARTEPDGDE